LPIPFKPTFLCPSRGIIVENQISHFQLLGELDARQNDVLQRLEDLDRRVKRVLDECLGKRRSSAAVENK